MNEIEKKFFDSLCKVVNSKTVWNIENRENKVIDFAKVVKKSKKKDKLDFILKFKRGRKKKIQVFYFGNKEYYKLYKPDFLFITPKKTFLVEIDGYQSHSSKDQLIHDKKRDREFMKIGIPTIRFTGSEVFKDSILCAKETIEIIANNIR